jgi:hypothetical protein
LTVSDAGWLILSSSMSALLTMPSHWLMVNVFVMVQIGPNNTDNLKK